MSGPPSRAFDLSRYGSLAAALEDAALPARGNLALVETDRGRRVRTLTYRELLARARALAGGEAGRVVAVSIPDWGATAFGRAQDRAAIAAGIDAMNALFQAEAEAAGAAWVDVTGLSRRAGEDPAFLARDGLHPSGAAYAEWAAAALPAARRALQGAPSPR